MPVTPVIPIIEFFLIFKFKFSNIFLFVLYPNETFENLIYFLKDKFLIFLTLDSIIFNFNSFSKILVCYFPYIKSCSASIIRFAEGNNLIIEAKKIPSTGIISTKSFPLKLININVIKPTIATNSK